MNLQRLFHFSFLTGVLLCGPMACDQKSPEKADSGGRNGQETTGGGEAGQKVPVKKRELPPGTSEGPGLTLRARDQQLIDALKAAGSDLEAPHRVIHQVTVNNRKGAQDVIDWGKENGFEPSDIIEDQVDNFRTYGVDLVRECPLDIEVINRDSRMLESLAMSLNAEYHGWGSEVVTP